MSSSGGRPGRVVEPDPVAVAGLITRDRLGSYLTATGSDLQRALALYDWNTRASAAVLATSAMVEVIVRNALDASFSSGLTSAVLAATGSMRRRWMRRAYRCREGARARDPAQS